MLISLSKLVLCSHRQTKLTGVAHFHLPYLTALLCHMVILCHNGLNQLCQDISMHITSKLFFKMQVYYQHHQIILKNILLKLFEDMTVLWSGPQFNIKMTSYQYRKSHCGDKTILRPSYLHNGISYTGKMSSLYWIRAQSVNGLTQWSLRDTAVILTH